MGNLMAFVTLNPNEDVEARKGRALRGCMQIWYEKTSEKGTRQ